MLHLLKKIQFKIHKYLGRDPVRIQAVHTIDLLSFSAMGAGVAGNVAFLVLKTTLILFLAKQYLF